LATSVKASDNLKATIDEPVKRKAAERLQQVESNLKVAKVKASQPPALVELRVFMNGEVSPFVVKAKPVHTPQLLRFRLEAPEDAQREGARFWRELLRGVATDSGQWGQTPIILGLSHAAATTTIPDTRSPESTPEFTLTVFTLRTLIPGILALLCFAFSFGLYARRTTLLRDNNWTVKTRTEFLTQEKTRADNEVTNRQTAADEANSKLTQNPQDQTAVEAKKAADEALAEAQRNAAKAEEALTAWDNTSRTLKEDTPIGPYSLGRTQMAVWFFLVIVGFIFIGMSLGQYQHLVTGETLVLLGISGVTGLAAIQITGDKAADRTTRNFFRDILGDAAGEPQLQRIQSVAWTFVLVAIFVYIALHDFRFEQFDTNLLLLMGIAQSFYIGFKFQEENKSKTPPEK
jgi:hypothetical protein